MQTTDYLKYRPAAFEMIYDAAKSNQLLKWAMLMMKVGTFSRAQRREIMMECRDLGLVDWVLPRGSINYVLRLTQNVTKNTFLDKISQKFQENQKKFHEIKKNTRKKA